MHDNGRSSVGIATDLDIDMMPISGVQIEHVMRLDRWIEWKICHGVLSFRWPVQGYADGHECDTGEFRQRWHLAKNDDAN